MSNPLRHMISRRRILALASGAFLGKAFAASLPSLNRGSGIDKAGFEVDRLLNGEFPSVTGAEPRLHVTRYLAGATVTLFSIPLVSRSSVGSGYAVVEEAELSTGHTLSIQFGAGSYPDRARGLNRLGYIQEAVVEEAPGRPNNCAWLAFMTTSQEKSLDQAKKALEASGAMVPYSASQGAGHNGDFTSRVDRLEFPGRYTWRDVAQLFDKAKSAMAAVTGEENGNHDHKVPANPTHGERSATFLYVVRRAMLDPEQHTRGFLVFNGKHFQLDATKETDETSTAYFAGKGMLKSGFSVSRLNAIITETHSGEKTPFRLWYETGFEQMPPLRFEYQAKSFLRLTFEADAKADTPPIRLAFRKSKEIA